MRPFEDTLADSIKVLLRRAQNEEMTSDEWLLVFQEIRRLESSIFHEEKAKFDLQFEDIFKALYAFTDIPVDRLNLRRLPKSQFLHDNPMLPIWFESSGRFRIIIYLTLSSIAKHDLSLMFVRSAETLKYSKELPRLKKILARSPWKELENNPPGDLRVLPDWLPCFPASEQMGPTLGAMQDWVGDLCTRIEVWHPSDSVRAILMHRFIQEFAREFGGSPVITPLSFMDEVGP